MTVWTETDTATLRRLYERTPWIGLRHALSGHTDGAIKARAHRLGLRRKGKGRAVYWTTTDINRLRRVYSSSSWRELEADFPDHTTIGIRKRAQALGLRRPPRRVKPRFAITRKLKQIREERGISQRELERRMGYASRAMAAIENGRDVYLTTLLAWVRALDLELVVKPMSASRLKERVKNVDVCGGVEERGAAGADCPEGDAGGEPGGVRADARATGQLAFTAATP